MTPPVAPFLESWNNGIRAALKWNNDAYFPMMSYNFREHGTITDY